MIKKVNKLILASVLMTGAAIANGSGHFIKGLQGQYPAHDLNDSYVFQSSRRGYSSFILSANPSKPGSGNMSIDEDFSGEGIYNIHIAQDDSLKTGMTLVFSFDRKNVYISKIDKPNASVGSLGQQIGKGKLGREIILSNRIRVWAGRGLEPFFGNGIGLGKFNALKKSGRFSPEVFKQDGDLFSNSSASFIVVDVPNKLLGRQVNFFTTAAVKHKDEWRQVDRHANVLYPYIFLSDTPAVYEDHEQHRPDSDIKERRQAIVNNIFWAASVAGLKPNEAMKHANFSADKITPDLLNYVVGTKASYRINKLNGRPLHDDAMNTALELMTGVAIDDNAYDGKRYSNKFPYIIRKN